MNPEAARQSSATELLSHGYDLPDHLPLIEVCFFPDREIVLTRLACLHLCAAVAYGLSKEQALSWAEAEGLHKALEPEEASFLQMPSRNPRFHQQIEGMFALCWALGTESKMDWFSAVDSQFVRRLPDLRIAEGMAPFKLRTSPRDIEEVVQATDLGYCVHWLWREAALGRGKTFPVREYVIAERRRAFEWLTGHIAWYEISLDT